MSRFGKATKKPIPIDWFIWDGNKDHLSNWLEQFGEKPSVRFILETETADLSGKIVKMQVKTMEGNSYDVPEGYIIIRGIKGEFYPCESKIFEESYNVL